MFGKGPGCRQRIRAAGTDRADPVVGLDHIAVPGHEKCGLGIRHDQQRFEMPQGAVLAPFLRQLDRGFRQISLMFLQLPFEPLEQGKRVRRRPGKTRQDFFVEKPPRFSRRVFHDVLAHGDLPVRRDHHFVVAAHAQYRCAMYRRKIPAHWHPRIIPRRAAATNAGFKIGLRAVSVAALFDALDSPRILWAFARNYFRTCCH